MHSIRWIARRYHTIWHIFPSIVSIVINTFDDNCPADMTHHIHVCQYVSNLNHMWFCIQSKSESADQNAIFDIKRETDQRWSSLEFQQLAGQLSIKSNTVLWFQSVFQ